MFTIKNHNTSNCNFDYEKYLYFLCLDLFTEALQNKRYET